MKQRNKEASQLKGDNEKSPLKQEMRAQYSMQQRACVARISYSALACPKLSLEPARQFRLDFEWRELRKRPTSACSHLICTAFCGRSFWGRYCPTPFASSHVRPNSKSHFVMPRTLHGQYCALRCWFPIWQSGTKGKG